MNQGPENCPSGAQEMDDRLSRATHIVKPGISYGPAGPTGRLSWLVGSWERAPRSVLGERSWWHLSGPR
jgi:hypothetical protein